MAETSFHLDEGVTVCAGVLHPGLHIPLDGWYGRITDIQQFDEDEVYVAVAWDSQTLMAMPLELIHYLHDMDWEWRGWVFTPDQLVSAAPRDTEAETEQAVAGILVQMPSMDSDADDIDEEDDLTLDIIEWGDDEYDDEESDWFDLDLFLDVLQIPAADRGAVRDALAQGIADYYQQQYGTYRYGKRPYFLIPSLLSRAPIFGYGTLAVLAETAVSLDSKQKIAYFACQTTDPFAYDHIPYGLISIISFLAAHNTLSLDLFRSVMLALELGGGRKQFAGWSLSYAQQLSTWLLSHSHMPQSEKQWWLWHIGANLEGQHFAKIGKALVPQWLKQAQLPYEIRWELAWAWIHQTQSVGTPPLNWQLMQATFAGNMEAAENIAAAMELAAQVDVDEADILADLEKTPHIAPIPDHHGPGNDPMGFLQMMMGMRFGGFVRLPSYVRRLAVASLIEMGEDVTLVAAEVFALAEDANAAALQSGLVDGLRQMDGPPPAAVQRQIIDQGIAIGQAPARKLFYALGAEWFGQIYWQQAAQDSAQSIRDWAVQYNK